MTENIAYRIYRETTGNHAGWWTVCDDVGVICRRQTVQEIVRVLPRQHQGDQKEKE